MKFKKIIVTIIRIALGGLFIYASIQKFKAPEPKPVAQVTTEHKEVSKDLPDHVVKIKAFIGGMKQTDYFWPFLGVVEILCGILLVSQYLALLGAVILIPLTLNIFFFHLFLEPDEVGELALTLLYLLANLALLAYDFPKLKKAFLPSTI